MIDAAGAGFTVSCSLSGVVLTIAAIRLFRRGNSFETPWPIPALFAAISLGVAVTCGIATLQGFPPPPTQSEEP